MNISYLYHDWDLEEWNEDPGVVIGSTPRPRPNLFTDIQIGCVITLKTRVAYLQDELKYKPKIIYLKDEIPIDIYNLLYEKGYKLKEKQVWIHQSYVPRPRIFVFTNKQWAFYRIHTGLIKVLYHKYEFQYYDWSNVNSINHLLNHYLEYDIILSNTTLFNKDYKISIYNQNEYHKRALPITHCPVFDMNRFTENMDLIPLDKYMTVGGICEKSIFSIYDKYKIMGEYCPAGVDIDMFKPTRKIDKIKVLGFIKHDHKNKRMDMFMEIVKKTGLDYILIANKNDFDYHLYDGIDMLICTSELESGPLGPFEAGSSGIPIISTPVGNIKKVKSVKTFTTVDEAVQIIQMLNQSQKTLETYINLVTTEIRTIWNWKRIANIYWDILIQKKLASSE